LLLTLKRDRKREILNAIIDHLNLFIDPLEDRVFPSLTIQHLPPRPFHNTILLKHAVYFRLRLLAVVIHEPFENDEQRNTLITLLIRLYAVFATQVYFN
jgi:hypothetical protein